ncbi:nuclear transport factor 2 family protein [Streptomyces sp. NPDC054842]
MTVALGSAERTSPGGEFAPLYAQAQHFYVRQMQLLDAHDTHHSWPDTFTEDAVLELPSQSEPVRVRTDLARCVRTGAQRLREAGGRLHHWVGMLDVQPGPDGALRTRCSALVHVAPVDGSAKVLYVCVMEDVLVCALSGEWRAAHRRVIRDDLI